MILVLKGKATCVFRNLSYLATVAGKVKIGELKERL